MRKFLLLTEEKNVFCLGEYSVHSVLSYLDCSFLRCLIGTSLSWFVLFWCPRMVLSLWRSFSYTLVWFSSLQLRKRMLFLRINSIFPIFVRCLGHFGQFDCGEIIKLIENAFMFSEPLSSFSIYCCLIVLTSEEGRFPHWEETSILICVQFIYCEVFWFLLWLCSVCNKAFGAGILSSFFWNLLSTPYILYYSFIGGSMRTLSSILIFDESYTSIIHSLTALSSTTLSFSAYFSVNWLAQNSKLSSGSADT